MGEKKESIYQTCRKEAGLTRAEASEALEFISEKRLERIEYGTTPEPEEVLKMSEVYRVPSLCNYYCTHECRIGQEYVPEVQVKSLPVIVLETLSALNTLNKSRDRLVEITMDEVISDNEIEDFARIREQLEKISLTVDSLNLWIEEKIASGELDEKKLEQ